MIEDASWHDCMTRFLTSAPASGSVSPCFVAGAAVASGASTTDAAGPRRCHAGCSGRNEGSLPFIHSHCLGSVGNMMIAHGIWGVMV